MVGIKEYDDYPISPHAVNDAAAVKNLLEAKGARVFYAENCSQKMLQFTAEQFLSSLQKDDVALLYFAGHILEMTDATIRLAASSLPKQLNRIENSLKLHLLLHRLSLMCSCRYVSFNTRCITITPECTSAKRCST